MTFLKDECSYVSLRDVERAMIVFNYMHEMMDILGPLMDQWAMREFAERAECKESSDCENKQTTMVTVWLHLIKLLILGFITASSWVQVSRPNYSSNSALS